MEMAALSATERIKSDAAKSLTEQELNKFLDTVPVVPPTPAEPNGKNSKNKKSK
jgi:hypothetical protein